MGIRKIFNEKNQKSNDEIEEEVEKVNENYQLKFKKWYKFLVNITFGTENIANSNLLFKSNIDIFAKELLIAIYLVKSKE